MIGGGDTGMDCVSNALREGAEDVLLLDVYPEVPVGGRYPNTPWPIQPRRLVTTYALEEGGERRFGRQVLGMEGEGGGVSRVIARGDRRFVADARRRRGQRVRDRDRPRPDRGRLHQPRARGAASTISASPTTARGNVKAGTFTTSVDRVYAAGDVRVGASLVVTAIAEGRRCARVVEAALRA